MTYRNIMNTTWLQFGSKNVGKMLRKNCSTSAHENILLRSCQQHAAFAHKIASRIVNVWLWKTQTPGNVDVKFPNGYTLNREIGDMIVKPARCSDWMKPIQNRTWTMGKTVIKCYSKMLLSQKLTYNFQKHRQSSKTFLVVFGIRHRCHNNIHNEIIFRCGKYTPLPMTSLSDEAFTYRFWRRSALHTLNILADMFPV